MLLEGVSETQEDRACGWSRRASMEGMICQITKQAQSKGIPSQVTVGVTLRLRLFYLLLDLQDWTLQGLLTMHTVTFLCLSSSCMKESDANNSFFKLLLSYYLGPRYEG